MNLSQHLCQGLIGIVGVICLMQCFTMDAKLSKAVTEAFIRLHRDGLLLTSLCDMSASQLRR
jgi:hypothetical protein